MNSDYQFPFSFSFSWVVRLVLPPLLINSIKQTRPEICSLSAFISCKIRNQYRLSHVHPLSIWHRNILLKNSITMCLWVFFLRVCLCAMHMQCLRRPEKDIRFPRIGVIDSCELPCESWEWYPSLWKSKKCSSQLSQISSFMLFIFNVIIQAIANVSYTTNTMLALEPISVTLP